MARCLLNDSNLWLCEEHIKEIDPHEEMQWGCEREEWSCVECVDEGTSEWVTVDNNLGY